MRFSYFLSLVEVVTGKRGHFWGVLVDIGIMKEGVFNTIASQLSWLRGKELDCRSWTRTLAYVWDACQHTSFMSR
jgi:hypothetical protein